MRIHPAVIALALVALLTGCGDDGSGLTQADSNRSANAETGKPVGDRDGCDLVTQEEAATAAGNAVKPGKTVGIVCIWEPENIDDDKNLQVSVGWVPIAAGGDPDAACQAGLPGIPNSKPFPQAGLGNSAYWEFTSGGRSNTGSLHICMDQGFLDTSAIGLRPEAELQQVAVSLAKTAVERL